MVDWNNINQHQSYAKIRADLETRITPDNYGFESGNWNLTELLTEGPPLGIICTQIIAGEANNGRRSPAHVPMAAPDGRGGFPFRLKVLTRQACDMAADGMYINGWSAGNLPKRMQTMDNTLFPTDKEAPLEGDVITLKRAARERLDPQERNKLMARGESAWYLTRKTIDADGCIWCEYGEALELLHRAGKRLVYPEFRRPDRSLEEAAKKGHGEKPRRIAQWHFEEVPADYSAPKARTRKPRGAAKDVETGGALTSAN